MRAAWRWFGPQDTVPLAWIAQAGARGVVTALHHVPYGTVWTRDAVAERRAMIEAADLTWDVVESLPISEAIKTQGPEMAAHLDAYRASLEAIAAEGIQTVCYNFMPVIDWTRTDLAWPLPHGGTAMRFDATDFAVFDIHLLARTGAAEGVPEEVAADALARYARMDDAACAKLAANVLAGLPGGQDGMTLADLPDRLSPYDGIPEARLRTHLSDFLAEVVPTAERLGLRLCCHPDDPPWPLLGLPRVVSTEGDYAALTAAVDSPANGITLCSGALGPRPGTDLPGMMRRLGDKVHFLHLRNVAREDDRPWGGSFHEADHLGGDTDMVALVEAVLAEEARRRAEGRPDADIPWRPDHGHDLMDDATRPGQPGYPAAGRMRGLAQIEGVIAARPRSMPIAAAE